MKESSVGGIKIKSMAKVGVAICVLFVIIIYFEIYRVDHNCQSLIYDTRNCIEGQKCAISLGHSSDYLTEQVRLFVVKQEPENMEHYFEEINSKNRENMVARLDVLYGMSEPKTVARLNEALQKSKELERLEMHAMRLIARAIGMTDDALPEAVVSWKLTAEEEAMSKEELQEKAYDLVYGEEYLLEKKKIEAAIDATKELVTDKMEEVQTERGDELKRTFIEQRIFIFLMMLVACVALWLVGTLIVHPIREHVRSIQADQKWKVLGVHELRYLAHVYNQIYDRNADYKKELEYAANHDALTGLSSRAVFEKMKDELRGKKVDLALILVDANSFKKINDTKGHKAGDQTIRRVAAAFGQLDLNNKCCVARIGGDEFAMFLRDVKKDYFPVIETEVKKMNQALSVPEGELPGISVSVGVAFSEEGYVSKMFRQADQAMYESKKNRILGGCLYQEEA